MRLSGRTTHAATGEARQIPAAVRRLCISSPPCAAIVHLSSAGFFLQELAIRKRERFHERVRHVLRGFLNEVAVEVPIELPGLCLATRTQLATTGGTFEARLELGRIEPADELDERFLHRLRHGV